MSGTATSHTESLVTGVALVTALPTVRTDFVGAFEFLEHGPPAVIEDDLWRVAAGVMVNTMDHC